MTVKELFEQVPREALCSAIVAMFADSKVPCGGEAAIDRVLDQFATQSAEPSAGVLRLADVGDGRLLDVTVSLPDGSEPYSILADRWGAVLGYTVDSTSLAAFGQIRCAKDIFWEMTFFGL